MAILRSTDGKFYEVADEQLDDKLIPAEELKDKLGSAATGPALAGPGAPQGGPVSVPGSGQVVIQIFTSEPGGPMGPPPEGAEGEGGEEEEVTAHGWCWRRNCFSNCWRRNCFRNCYR